MPSFSLPLTMTQPPQLQPIFKKMYSNFLTYFILLSSPLLLGMALRTIHTFILRQRWERMERVERRDLLTLLRAHPDIHRAL